VAWRISNVGAEQLRLEDAWLPHGRFRGQGHVPLYLIVEGGGSSVIELTVSASEPPGAVVKNAFFILRAGVWRIFARQRIEFDDAAQPTPIVEQVTVQSLSSSEF
jgi:hypothetical protein